MTSPPGRRRALGLALVLAGIVAVAVADQTATAVGRALGPGTFSVGVSVGGYVVGGWAVGMALRLQVAPAAKGDRRMRVLLGVPCGLLAGWPLLLAAAPAALTGLVPGWALALQRVAPFGGAALGVVVALAVAPRSRRR